MDQKEYAVCPTSSSEDVFYDETSTFLRETEPGKRWRSMETRTSAIIASLIFFLTLLNGLSLYLWLDPNSKQVTAKAHSILDYFRKLFKLHSGACPEAASLAHY